MKKFNKIGIESINKNTVGIYKIIINSKIYIGSSCDIHFRLKHHLWSLYRNMHHNRTMQNLYNKYHSLDNMYVEIVEICKKDDLLEREKYYIDLLNPYINHILDPIKLVRDNTYKQRLSEAGKKSFKNGRVIHNKKKTYMYDLSGNYLKEFEDATSAAMYLGSYSPTSICNVCRNNQCSAFGYRWSYEKLDKLPSYQKRYKLSPVLQLSIDNKLIKAWPSMIEASKILNIPNIARAIKYNRTAGGFRWQKSESPL